MPVAWDQFEPVEETKSPTDWSVFEPVEDKPRGASGTWEEAPAAEAPDWAKIEANYNRIYQPPTEPDQTLGETLRESLQAKGTVMGIPAQALALVPRPTAQQVQDAADLITNPLEPGAPSRPPGEAAKIAAGVLNVGRGIGEGFVSPLGLATLGAGALPAAAQRGISAAFAADMASQIPEQARRAGEASITGDTQEQVEAFGNLAVTPAMTAAIGLHAAAPRIPPEIQHAVDRGVDAGLNKSAAAALKVAERKPIEVKTTVEPLKEEVPNAITEPSPESVSQPEIRPRVGEEAPLRQQGEVASAQAPDTTPREPARPQGSQESQILLADRVATMTPEQVANYAKETRAGGSSPTAESYKLGRETTTPEQLAKLKAHEAAAKAEFDAALAAENVDALSPLAAKKQFFTEAIEEAVGAAQYKGKDLQKFNERMAAGEVQKPTTTELSFTVPERQAPVAEQGVGAVPENVPGASLEAAVIAELGPEGAKGSARADWAEINADIEAGMSREAALSKYLKELEKVKAESVIEERKRQSEFSASEQATQATMAPETYREQVLRPLYEKLVADFVPKKRGQKPRPFEEWEKIGNDQKNVIASAMLHDAPISAQAAKEFGLTKELTDQGYVLDGERYIHGAPAQGELAAMGAATPGSFPTPPSPAATLFQNLLKPLAKARATASQLWQSRNVRDAMAFTRDAGENEAALFGRQAANEVRNAVRREFPKELARAEDALTAVIEAGGDAEALAANRAKLEASTAGSQKWRKRSMDAHDFALYNLDKLNPIAEQYRGLTDAQVTAEHGAGVDTLKRDRYVMHAQDLEDPSLFGRGGGGEPSGFRKNRTYESFADSIAAGVDPKTINAVDLLDTRLRNGQRLINNRAWVEGLRSMTDPKTGAPIAENPVTVTRADGSTYQQAPDGYKLESLGRQPIAIKNGYEGIFTALTDPSAFSKNAVGRGFLTANGTGKSINLLFDTFHLGRLAFWESLIKGLGVKTFEAPLPSYRKGATLLDFSEAEIRNMAANGEVPTQWLPELVRNKQRLDTLVENGYNVGRVSDALYQDLIHHIPVVGHFNKWLFEKFQRGAMAEVGLLEYERRKAARPEESDAQIARAVAKDLNTRFGNLGRQGVFKSRTAQDLARTIFLAPQWNEGLIRSELGAVKQLGELAADTAQGKRVFSGVLLRSVGAMALGQFAANQLINYYTRGHPTWENPEEGFGAKLSAWIPDKVGNGPGFFLHPMGLAAETTHLLMQKYEKTGDSAKVLSQYARSRSSAAMRPVLTFLTREDELGRKIKPDNIWGTIVNSAIPAPIGGSAIVQGAKEVVTKEPSETFPGQFQKQMMASVGVKTEQAPGAQSRIRTLASDFNKAKGIEPKAEFYEGDYVPLLKALQIGNQTDAKAAMDELRKIKTPQQLQAYGKQMAQRPFTGNKAREVEFRRGLSPVQQKAYEEALAERRRIQQEFFRLLRS